MCESLHVMKHYIENNELHIESDASDKWSGKTKAVKRHHQITDGKGQWILECGQVTIPGGTQDRLMIRLSDKPQLAELARRWEDLNQGPLDLPAQKAIEEAKRTGKTVVISSWTELRRYRDCGQSVEGMCIIERIARADGTLGQNVTPCH